MLYLLQVSATVYTIEGLLPFTDYEVRVCLYNVNPENCGGCLICFRTTEGQGNNHIIIFYLLLVLLLFLHLSTLVCLPIHSFHNLSTSP